MPFSARTALAALGLLGLLTVPTPAPAADEAAPAVTAKSAFARMKTMAGEWKSETPDKEHGHGEGKAKVVYSLTAGGTALMEHQFPASDHEMVSVYHLDGDDLKMTHYCAIGNQPRMKLDRKASTPTTLVFVFDGGTNFDPAKDMHIHALTVEFKEGGKVVENWQAFEGGKKAHELAITLVRQ